MHDLYSFFLILLLLSIIYAVLFEVSGLKS